LGVFGFGYEDDPRSVFVQSVDNAWTLDLPPPFHLRSMCQNGRHQGPSQVARGWVHHEPGWLVDHQDILILE
jgi:hypothetical protein